MALPPVPPHQDGVPPATSGRALPIVPALCRPFLYGFHSARHRCSRSPWAICLLVATAVAAPCQGDVASDSMRRTPVVEAVQQAIPAVVNIHGQKTIEAREGLEGARRVNGMGTGVIIDPRGYILTNYHVIDGVRPIQVTLHDDRTYNGQLVARDSHTDLAIIRIETKEPMKLIKIGTSSDLLPGESVIAVGNAYGYHHTVTKGIISSLQRTVQVN